MNWHLPRLTLVALALASGVPQRARCAPDPALAPYFSPATPSAAAPDSDGFVRRWLLLEPVVKPNRTNQGFTAAYVRAALAPASLAPDMPHDGQVISVDGSPVRWHALDAGLFDVKLFNFAQSLGKPSYGVIFRVATIIDADHDIADAHLAVGSNAASVWWVNGVETVGLFGDRRMVMDDMVSPAVTLHKGRNILRGAVINGPGLSDFCLRFIDGAGAPITAFKVVTQ